MFLRNTLKKMLVTPEIEKSFERIPKPVGSFGFDPWGYNTEGAKIWMGLFKPLFDHYFRVKTFGLENIPTRGRVLLVANHSGQLPVDGGLIGVAMATNPSGPRAPRLMVDRWVPTIPFLGNAFNEGGAVLGDPVNCAKMLRNEEAVIVFPEGVRGSGKPFRKRYQLQRFGQGFMHLALQEKAPIIPVGVVGGEEVMPSLANLNLLAHLLRMPYFPVCPPFPLPVHVRLYFGEPMMFEGSDESEIEVQRKVSQVKTEIAALVKRGLRQRKGWFA